MNKEAIRQQIVDTANRRYATKKYDPHKHIDPADWQTILEAGRLSPSSFGYEPWKFILINSPQVKEDIRPFAWGVANSLNGADKLLLILARTDVTYDSDYVRGLVEGLHHHQFSPDSKASQSFKHFQERDMAINNDRERFDWASKQTYIAMANMMTAAAELDIDSCPLEGFNYQKMDDYLTTHGIIDPKHWRASVMVSFGYRDQPIKPKVRQPLGQIYEELN
ncbi:NAD(P)H-dependent oxidoreductase [Limosilactobacillus pontis]|uniref:NAD(P)H-dependent oxidoreductase n=1 Tax=Limosilactobacillus pontis TaxID=35787 RepID=A0ABU7SSR7_9LACO|nr:NAD(P)H-dependent oxidoreductase [uncultured Limosilactobacillus sp.]